MLNLQNVPRSRPGTWGKAVLMLVDSASARIRDMPNKVMAWSSDNTWRLRPNWALLAMRRRLAVRVGSFEMMAFTSAVVASGSFKVRISAWATSDMTGSLADSKKAVRVGMNTPYLKRGIALRGRYAASHRGEYRKLCFVAPEIDR